MKSSIRSFFVALTGIAVIAVTAFVFMQTQFIKRVAITGKRYFQAKKTPPLSGLPFSGTTVKEHDSAFLEKKERSRGSRVSIPQSGGIVDHLDIRTLADTFLKSGEYKKAEELLERLLVWYPGDEDIKKKAIWAYEALSKPLKALPLYEQLLKWHPDDTYLTSSAAKTFAWAGEHLKALHLYRTLIESSRASDLIKSEYADLLYLDRQYVNAEAQYRELWKFGALQKKQALNFYVTLDYAGKYAEALELLDSLAIRYPGDVELLSPTAATTFALQQYDRSIALCYEVLRYFPENEQALSTIARVSSWQRDYDTALAYYDKLIATTTSTPLFYREKARVLGWMTSYGEALSLYADAMRAFPGHEALLAEAEAKKAYYNNAYRHSVRAYKRWLALEPRHPEALFDLGQLLMRNGRWKEAIEVYDSLLVAIPDHRQARAAKEKTVTFSSMTLVRTNAEYFRAKSSGRLTDLASTGVTTSITHPLNDRVSLFTDLERKSYRFVNSPLKPSAQRVMVGAEYRNQPDIRLRAAAGIRHNSDNLKDSPIGYVEAESSPVDNLHIALRFRRDEVIENSMTLINHLQKSEWQGKVLYDGFQRWNAGVDYELAHYSDGNTRITTGADVITHILYDPYRLNLTYRVQNYRFTESREEYWTPSSFITHRVGLEWQHQLRQGELFQGGKEFSYNAAYRMSFEPAGSISRQVEVGVQGEWSNRLSTSLSYQHTWNSVKDIYLDDRLNAEIRWYF